MGASNQHQRCLAVRPRSSEQVGERPANRHATPVLRPAHQQRQGRPHRLVRRRRLRQPAARRRQANSAARQRRASRPERPTTATTSASLITRSASAKSRYSSAGTTSGVQANALVAENTRILSSAINCCTVAVNSNDSTFTEAGTKATIAAGLTVITTDTAITAVTTARATYGADTATLPSAASNLGVQSVNTVAALQPGDGYRLRRRNHQHDPQPDSATGGDGHGGRKLEPDSDQRAQSAAPDPRLTKENYHGTSNQHQRCLAVRPTSTEQVRQWPANRHATPVLRPAHQQRQGRPHRHGHRRRLRQPDARRQPGHAQCQRRHLDRPDQRRLPPAGP